MGSDNKVDNLMFSIINRRAAGEPAGIYSACSADRFVLEAVIESGVEYGRPVLIESTANQCNQFGGYMRMRPDDFFTYVTNIAHERGLPEDMLILGGDHLGPLVWQNENVAPAMEKAKEMVRQYVFAGFTKIHIDTSMRLGGDDTGKRLPDETIAERAAELARACEGAYAERKASGRGGAAPVYVIGSEVPIPGGAREPEDSVRVTTAAELSDTYDAFRGAFYSAGVGGAFQRVVAIVAQPGVEFGDETIVEYDRAAARGLTGAIKAYDGVVLEGHSTDYQTRYKLKEMVEDGVAILKVGPALTFYCREALFALAGIEGEMGFDNPSGFVEALDRAMLREPGNWIKHYRGPEKEVALKRKYSYSDRCRYYMPEPVVQAALRTLIDNINAHHIPISLISQYLPGAYAKMRETGMAASAENMIKDRIKGCIADYMYATR